MIVFLGVVVGGMVVAMYLPIFDMINAVQEFATTGLNLTSSATTRWSPH